jgi:hypothetical protein
MQNIARIKEVLDSISDITSEYVCCQDPESAESVRKDIGSVKTNLLKTYNKCVSERFAMLDPILHSLFNEHFSSLVLSIGDLQQVHDTQVRTKHIDTNTFHNLRITKIQPILRQIDQRLLAMNVTLQGLSVVAKRNP